MSNIFLITLYRILSVILYPFLFIYLRIRILYNKEDKKRIQERFGYPSEKIDNKFLIWIHGASVGECNSAFILIDELLYLYPATRILFTSTTLTSAKEIEKKIVNNDKIIHQFIPIDTYFSVRRFINYWKPNLTIFMESEIWPNVIFSLRMLSELIIVNGRLSNKSYKRWKFLKRIGFNIFENFSYCFAQSKKDEIFFKKLGVKNVSYLFNLKSFYKTSLFDKAKYSLLKKTISNRQLLLITNLHKEEEKIISELCQKLKNHFPKLLIIIVPRHLRRSNFISELRKKFSVITRSKKEEIKKETDIYFADTMGELSIFYRLCNFALICGSLVKNIGGHSPYEPLSENCLPISGKFIDNFYESYQELAKDNLAILADNENIFLIVKDLIVHEDKMLNFTNRIKEYNKTKLNSLNLLTNKLSKFINHNHEN